MAKDSKATDRRKEARADARLVAEALIGYAPIGDPSRRIGPWCRAWLKEEGPWWKGGLNVPCRGRVVIERTDWRRVKRGDQYSLCEKHRHLARAEMLHESISMGDIGDRHDWSRVRPHEYGEVLARAQRIVSEAAERGFGAASPKRTKRGEVPDDASPGETLLTLAETAKILGIALGTLRNRCADGRFNSTHGLTHQIGKRSPRVRRSLLMRAIADGP